MGWWWPKQQQNSENQPGSDSHSDVHKDVLAAGREACYRARDNFFACIERKGNSKPTEVASVGLLYPSECKKARADFVKHCRPTWVKHFDRQYAAKKRVERLMDPEGSNKGAMSLPQPYTFKQ
eukprot:TRINITY_DN20394_c0_g1_i1.p1 TRINITY_DN20394_c0_g1~~TRINITY_DN20394_c0_g1_i1.p1  ORF type:complete len:123 (-),score=14.21 TRINITY_DN20394_c0_g1_i1:248-616(-)